MTKINKLFLVLMTAVLTAVACLTGCDLNADIVENITSSKVVIFLNNTEIDGDTLENDTLTVDLDTLGGGADMRISAYHVLQGGFYSKKPFTITVSPDIKIYEKTDTSILLLSTEIEQLGRYMITMKSSINEKYDKQLILDLKMSSVNKLTLSYEVQEEYKALLEGVDEAILKGTIDEFNTEVVWAKGATYTIKAVDMKSEMAKLMNVVVDDNTKAYVKGTTLTPYITVIGNEDDNVKITATVGYTNVKREFTVKTKYCGDMSFKNYVLEKEEEKTISLKKGKSETFKLTHTSPDETPLVYSINAEVIYQDHYYDNLYKKYIPEINPNATWNEINTLIVEDDYMWNETDKHEKGNVLFEINVDNTTNLFTITARESSIYTTKFDSTERNLHKYLYIKMKTDTQWRWKIRILVDGVLEGIEFYKLEGNDNEEVYIGDTLEMTENNSRSNMLRAKFIPETYDDDEIWFFLADPKKTREYTINGVKTVLPCPIGDEVVPVDEALFNVISFTSNDSGTTIGGGDLKIKKGVHFRKQGLGNVDVSTNYNNTGDDVKIVAINPNSGKWTSVLFKCIIDNAMTIKSVRGNGNTDVFSFLKTRERLNKYIGVKREEDSNTLKYMQTGYDGSSLEQAYPNTVVKTPKERTFFIQVNGELEIEATTTFDIKDITLTVDSNATRFLGGAVVEVSKTNPRKAIITVNTVWSAISGKNGESYNNNAEIVKQMFMTTEDGVLTYLTVNNGKKDYLVPIRFIVYYDTKASL